MTATKKAAPVLEHRDGQRVEKKSLQALSTPILLNRRELSRTQRLGGILFIVQRPADKLCHLTHSLNVKWSSTGRRLPPVLS